MARGPKKCIELCDLTEWHVPPGGGRGRKAVGKQKWTVEIDRRNWSLCIVREGYPSIGEKFSSNLRLFFCGIKMRTGVDIWEAINIVNEALAELLGKRMEIDRAKGIMEVAEAMDNFYKVDLLSDNLNPIFADRLEIKSEDLVEA